MVGMVERILPHVIKMALMNVLSDHPKEIAIGKHPVPGLLLRGDVILRLLLVVVIVPSMVNIVASLPLVAATTAQIGVVEEAVEVEAVQATIDNVARLEENEAGVPWVHTTMHP